MRKITVLTLAATTLGSLSVSSITALACGDASHVSAVLSVNGHSRCVSSVQTTSPPAVARLAPKVIAHPSLPAVVGIPDIRPERHGGFWSF